MQPIEDHFAEQVQRLGREFVVNLAILLKVLDFYSAENESVRNAADKFLETLTRLIGDNDDLTVKFAARSVFIEDLRVKETKADVEIFGSLGTTLEKRSIGRLVFRRSLEPMPLIQSLAAILGSEDFQSAQAALEQTAGALVIGEPEAAMSSADLDMNDTRLMARRACARSVASVTDIYQSIAAGKALNIRKTKRSLQSLVDAVIHEERYVLSIAFARDRENYVFMHSVATAVLCIAMGKQLGLSKVTLSKLGMAALFHDIGRAVLPQELIHKRGGLSPDEDRKVRMHPIQGVRKLIRSRGLNDDSMITMLVSFEHHMQRDDRGYPRPDQPWSPTMYSRLIHVADVYDNLLNNLESAGTVRRTPQRVLHTMQAHVAGGGGMFDPQMVALLAQIAL